MNKSLSTVLLTVASYLFCASALLDPRNSIFGLKIPTFVFFIFCLGFKYKPKLQVLALIIFLLLLQFISYLLGCVQGLKIDTAMTIQYAIFYTTLISIMWAYKVDIFGSIIFASWGIAIITIVGSLSMSYSPAVLTVLYEFAESHDRVFIVAQRQFLGFEVNNFVYSSIPIIIMPASYYFNQFLLCKKGKFKYLVLSSIFIFALLCAGNRTMMLGAFTILFFSAYPRLRRYKLFRPIMISIGLVALYIAYLAITEKGEQSSDIKFGHARSYMQLYSDHWYNLIFGTGVGSYFYSEGINEMTNNTELSYFEIIRTNGMIGLILFGMLLVKPLLGYKKKLKTIKDWSSVSFGYILYLLVAGSNPFLMSSTGLIYILFMYSYVQNEKYKKDEAFSMFGHL